MYLRFFLPIVFAVLVFGLTSSLQEAYAGTVLPDCEKSFDDTFALSSQNSVLIIDPCDLDDMPWTLNEGASHLSGQELFICEIVDGVCIDVGRLEDFTVSGSFFSGDELFITYRDFARGVAILVNWELIGGEPGSNDSTLNETIEIFRITEGTATYRFFQETDFDLADGSTDTSVQISSTLGQQVDSTPEDGPRMKGTVSVSPPADEIMAGIFDDVADAITGVGELDGTAGPITGPGDYVFGFSWDFDISPGKEGNSFIIKKTKQLEPLGDKNVLSIEGGHPFIHAIDPVTARTISSVEITLDESFSEGLVVNGGTGLAFNPVDGKLYALLSVSDDPGGGEGDGTGGGKTRHLATINPQTGIATLVGDTGVKKIASLTFDSGTLFSVNLSAGRGGTGTLSIISTVDGSVTNFCELDTDDGTGLAFNPDDGFLYYATDGEFQRIDDFTVTKRLCDETELASPDFTSALVFFNSFLIVDGSFQELSSITDEGDETFIGEMDHFSRDLAVITPILTKSSGGGPNEPPTIGKNNAGTKQMVEKGICIDEQCWTVIENFHEDFELVEMLTSPHTISNTIYCARGVDKCNHITLSAEPYGTDVNSAIWKVSLDKSFQGDLTVTKDDPDNYLGDTTCTAQIIEKKYWGTSCTIDFLKPTPGMMLGVQVWDSYGGVRNFYFNDGIEVIDTYGYPSVDTEFEPSLDLPRVCLVDNPDKRISCAFAEKMRLEIERAEKLLEE